MHSTEKARLRAEFTAGRQARAADEIADVRTAVRAAVLARCAAAGWMCVAAYVPLRTEPGSVDLLTELTDRGVRVLVPVLLPDRDLDWADWDAAGAQPGPPAGPDQIASADAVLVPALAVARDGTRLGRGGGSYDRALARLPAGVPIAALLFDGELVESLPQEQWDRPVTAVVTPDGWQDLSRTYDDE
ncbi:MAG: sle [Pseudonocardiales bacterium]|nr:sle [Pseudonocardiales bacterium]